MKIKAVSILLVLLCASGLSVASSIFLDIDKLIRVSGLGAQIEQVESSIEQQMMEKIELDPNITLDGKEEVRVTIKKVYDARDYKKALKTGISHVFSEQEITELLEIYTNFEAVKRAAAAQDKDHPNFKISPDVFSRSHPKNISSYRKLKAVTELIAYLNLVNIQHGIYRGNATTFALITKAYDSDFSEEIIISDIDNELESMKPEIFEEVKDINLYHFRYLNDDEVDKYVSTVKSHGSCKTLYAIYQSVVTGKMQSSAARVAIKINQLKGRGEK